MSLTALANNYINNRYATSPSGPPATGSVRSEVEALASGSHGSMAQTGGEVGKSDSTKNGDAGTFVDKIMTYIPSEVISAYVPLVALATSAATIKANIFAQWFLFAVFLVSSPIAVILIAYGKYRRLPPDPQRASFAAPKFDMTAAFIGFIAWAAVIPSSVFSTINGFEVWMGTAAVIIVTFLLSLIGPVVQEKS